MRLASIEKGEFYSDPIHMAEATASWFIPLPAGTRGRLLDPCCGEGKIASQGIKIKTSILKSCSHCVAHAVRAAYLPRLLGLW